jgi:hypothetical protein
MEVVHQATRGWCDFYAGEPDLLLDVATPPTLGHFFLQKNPCHISDRPRHSSIISPFHTLQYQPQSSSRYRTLRESVRRHLEVNSLQKHSQHSLEASRQNGSIVSKQPVV